MRPQSTKEAVRSRLIARATGLLGVVLLVACLDDERLVSPTAPPSPVTPAPVSGWSGSWSIDRATPAEDCLAESINANLGYYTNWQVGLKFEQNAGSVSLRFELGDGYNEAEGFFPLDFAGTIGADGVIVASAPASRLGAKRGDPWGELCYWEWRLQESRLAATLSLDGRRMSGNIVERYRVESNGATFTIYSRFAAEFR